MQKLHLGEIKKQLTDKWKQNIPTRLSEDWDILSVIFVIALALRIYFGLLSNAPHGFGALEDLKAFEKIAVEWEFDTYHPPLYPLLLRLIYNLFGDFNYQAVFIIQGIISSFMIFPMHKIGTLLCNRTAGVIAAGMISIYPDFIIYNITTLPDAFGICLVVLIITAALVQMTENFRACISAGLIGTGILLEPILLFLVPGMLITVKKRLLFICILIAILTPWTIRNSILRRKFTPTYYKTAYKIDMRKYKKAPTVWHIVHSLYNNTSMVFKRGWSVSSKMGKIEKNRSSSYTAAYAYTLIMVLGLTGLGRYYRKEHRAIVLPFLGYIVLLIFMTRFKIRFRIYLEPLLIIYTSILVSRQSNILSRIFHSSRKRS